MNFHVVTLFPETIEAYTNASILGRAQKNKLISVKTYQLRDFVTNKWGKADEKPYGGGPGMVLTAEPVIRAVEKITSDIEKSGKRKNNSNKSSKRSIMIYHNKPKVLITSAGGKEFTNKYAENLAKKYKDVVIVCGRYEGIDVRAKKALKAEEISVGPYILTGGEVPALAIIDATARRIPGVLGKLDSLEESRIASHDVYTRPAIMIYHNRKYRVPKVLLSGHHAKINELREKKRSGKHG